MTTHWLPSIIIGGLCAFRISLLFSKEDGPLFIFRKLRQLPKAKTSLKEGLSCQWCLSVWFSAPVTVYECWLGWFPRQQAPLFWLAISALAICINQQWTRDDR